MASEVTVRGLSEGEVPRWAKFCEACFSYKKPNAPPASYFERHFFNDPRRDAGLIRVAMTADDEIVSSVRIFKRTLSLGPWRREDDGEETVEAGGIGEVCTKESHQRRGLSRLLLNDALEIMKGLNMDMSLLHASPTFQPVYAKVGFVSVCSKWSCLKVDPKAISNNPVVASDPMYFVKKAIFPQDISRLHIIHKKFSESRFAGCVVRSEDYWRDYALYEVEGNLRVLVRGVEPQDDSTGHKPGDICGWLSLRYRSGKYQVQDFGVDEEVTTSGLAFSLLLKGCLDDFATTLPREQSNNTIVIVPSPVLNELKKSKDDMSGFDFNSDSSDDDDGWMYKVFNEGNNMVEICRNIPHLIWPLDSF